MPPDWDADSPELRQNLAGLLESIEEDARQRKRPTVETARRWQSETMRNLQADDPKYVGAFRGEAGLEDVQVHVNWVFGVAAPEVADALREFEQHLQSVVAYLDNMVPPDTEPNADQTKAIVAVCRMNALDIQCPRRGPHALRHACAAHLVAEGMSLKQIGDHLGHRSSDATRTYAKPIFYT